MGAQVSAEARLALGWLEELSDSWSGSGWEGDP